MQWSFSVFFFLKLSPKTIVGACLSGCLQGGQKPVGGLSVVLRPFPANKTFLCVPGLENCVLYWGWSTDTPSGAPTPTLEHRTNLEHRLEPNLRSCTLHGRQCSCPKFSSCQVEVDKSNEPGCGWAEIRKQTHESCKLRGVEAWLRESITSSVVDHFVPVWEASRALISVVAVPTTCFSLHEQNRKLRSMLTECATSVTAQRTWCCEYSCETRRAASTAQRASSCGTAAGRAARRRLGCDSSWLRALDSHLNTQSSPSTCVRSMSG